MKIYNLYAILQLIFTNEIYINFIYQIYYYCLNSSPLYKAVEEENIEIVKLLLQFEKLDVNFQNI